MSDPIFTPEQQTAIDSAVKDAISKYVKADSALHVFIREHSQAAFNCALFGGLIFGGVAGRFGAPWFI